MRNCREIFEDIIIDEIAPSLASVIVSIGFDEN